MFIQFPVAPSAQVQHLSRYNTWTSRYVLLTRTHSMHCSSRACVRHTTQHPTARRLQRQYGEGLWSRCQLLLMQAHRATHRYSPPRDTQTKLVKAAWTLKSSHSAALGPPHLLIAESSV